MVVNAARGSHMTDDATKLTQLLQPELAKPAEAQDAVEAKKHRREELKARLAKDAAKAETASAAQAEQNNRRLEELKAKLAATRGSRSGQEPARRSSCRAGCRRSRKAPPLTRPAVAAQDASPAV
jgi:hypothetical protein